MTAGKPISIDHATAEFTRKENGSHHPGWLSFRPLYNDIIREQPDLLDE